VDPVLSSRCAQSLVLVIYHADATPDASPPGGGGPGEEAAREESAEESIEAAGSADAEAELCALGFFDGVVAFAHGEVRLARRCTD
jgi:hypothetical protein